MPTMVAAPPRIVVALIAWPQAQLEAERDRWPIWLPVFMGAGVLGYFSLRFEPPLWAGATVLGPALLAWALGRQRRALRPLLPPLIALSLGFSASQFATARAPPLETGLPTHASIITGTVGAVEVLPDGRRVTLAAVRLQDGSPPIRRLVHVRLRKTDTIELVVGDTMRVRAILRPPPPPAYPGAWDVQRDQFFDGSGSGGYALGPAERLARGTLPGPMAAVQRLRETIQARILAALPGPQGSIAVTLLVGESRGIPEADQAAFRDSGMAHLLSVSGLHIAIVMGCAMALTRLLLAASEHASLFWPAKQIAAGTALFSGAAYTVISGMQVPMLRSFFMAALFTLALLSGRRAASLRGLAVAAAALLLIEPQALPGASMQMSFSAVLALISGYETLRPQLRQLDGRSWHRRFSAWLLGLALTSALAGTASLPFGAYHFGRIQVYYIVANMAAVPITGLLVMPAGMIALPLMLVGLDWLALGPMGWGIQGILAVAHTTASWPAATLTVPHMPAWGLAVLSFGLAWLGIWRSRLRLFGLAAIAVGVASPVCYRPPDVLVSADARLIAIRTTQGIWFERTGGGSRFTQDSWQHYWAAAGTSSLPKKGEAAEQAISCTPDACMLRPHPDRPGALLVRKSEHRDACGGIAVIVSAQPARRLCPQPWPKLVDRFTVWRDGATAIWLDGSEARVLTDRTERGTRPWVPPPPQPRRRSPPTLPPAEVDTAD